MGMNATAETLR